MRGTSVAASLIVLAGLYAAFAAEGERKMAESAQKASVVLALTSPAFKDGQAIPKQHTGEGKDVSPALHWSGVPKNTKSFALIMDDPDAPAGTWVHWVLYDIPAGRKDVPEGLAKKEEVLEGAKHGLCWGVASFSKVGYYGPLPPPGTPHHYHFKLYALDKVLGLKARATKDEVLKAMAGHVFAQGELTGLYQR